jgi:hypothetical protein
MHARHHHNGGDVLLEELSYALDAKRSDEAMRLVVDDLRVVIAAHGGTPIADVMRALGTHLASGQEAP